MSTLKILLTSEARDDFAVERVENVIDASTSDGVLRLQQEGGVVKLYNSNAWLTAQTVSDEEDSW